ncbi:hypothetical protein D3C85_1151730 [compost metagenome]
MPAFGGDKAKCADGDVTCDIEGANAAGAGVLCLQHLQADRPGERADRGLGKELEILITQLPLVPRLHGLDEEVAFGQRAEIAAGIVPEVRQPLVVKRTEIDTPEVLQHLVAMQAHFVGFIVGIGVGANGIETAIHVEQIGVVLVGDTKAVDHQLRQGHGGGWRGVDMFPAGKGFRAALRGVEAVEVDLVGIQSGDGVLLEQICGDLVSGVLQAGAGLNDGGGNRLECGLIGSVG